MEAPTTTRGPAARTDGAASLGDEGRLWLGDEAVEALVRPEEVVAEEQVREGQVLEPEEEARGRCVDLRR